MKINVQALTEKGALKPIVRKTLVNYVAENPEVFAQAERVGEKAVFTLPVYDAEGNTVYVNFDVTVSTVAAADRAERKPKAKVKAEAEDVTIDLE